MTHKEALQCVINYPLPEKAYEKALLDRGLDGDSPYKKEYKKDIDLCALELVFTLLSSADVREGGYSLSYGDRNALVNLYSAICRKYSLADTLNPKSTVRGIRPW